MFRPSSRGYSTEKNTVMTKKNNGFVITVFFVEYLPEDGQKVRNVHIFVYSRVLYPPTVQLLERIAYGERT